MSVNQVILTGRIGTDIEFQTSKSGKNFVRFRFAVDEYDGGKRSTFWVSCMIFQQRQIEVAQKYLTKGVQIVVAGRLSVNEYEGKNYVSVFVDQFNLPARDKNTNSASQEPKINDGPPF